VNILLFTERDLIDATRLRVADQRLAHLLDVHGARPGDTVRVGRVNGACGTGTITSIDDTHADLELALDKAPPDKLPLTLVLALPRPKMLRRILRTVGECGIRELHLINSYKVEKSFWQSPLLAPATLEDYLLAGLEQASDTMVPTCSLHHRFKPFVEDVLPALCDRADAVVAHPGDHPILAAASGADMVMVIGPEGGFTDYEVRKCRESGCRPVSLGPRVLRVETAVAAALGVQLAGAGG